METQTVSQALVPMTDTGPRPLTVHEELNAQSDYYASFDALSAEDEMMILNAMSTSDEEGKDAVGKTLSVVGAVVYRSKSADKDTGELREQIMTCVLLEDGTSITTSGVYVPSFFGRILLRYGRGKFSPPLQVAWEQKKLPSGHYAIKPRLAAPYIPEGNHEHKPVKPAANKRKA